VVAVHTSVLYTHPHPNYTSIQINVSDQHLTLRIQVKAHLHSSPVENMTNPPFTPSSRTQKIPTYLNSLSTATATDWYNPYTRRLHLNRTLARKLFNHAFARTRCSFVLQRNTVATHPTLRNSITPLSVFRSSSA
jgi:hypothetical protein